MIAEFGHFALICALCVCLAQAGAGLAGAGGTLVGTLVSYALLDVVAEDEGGGGGGHG